jgi:hypothetical protein
VKIVKFVRLAIVVIARLADIKGLNWKEEPELDDHECDCDDCEACGY